MECQSEHDRDVNAAKNLLKFYTGGSPGINACGDTSSLAIGSKITLNSIVIF